MKHPLVTFAHAEGKPVKLDIQRLAETRLLAQASSGGGKSYLLRKLLETTHGKIQQLIIDPEGEFSSLRKKYDYVYIAKGEATEPDPRTAGTLARSLLQLEVSAILDIFELHPRDRRKFVRNFLEALIDSPKNLWHPALVLVDEAHEFAPEQSESEALDAVIALAAKGRKRDFACVIATQRPAKLHKDVSAELQNRLIGLANQDIDRKRAGDDIGFRSKEDILGLRKLEPGEFYAVGPAFRVGDERLRDPLKIQCDPVETPHGRKARRWRPTRAANSKQVKAALSALAALPKQAEQEIKDLEAARARVRELEKEARELRKGGVEKKPDPEKLKKVFEEGRQSALKEFSKVANQIRSLKNKLTARLQELGLLVAQIPELGSDDDRRILPPGTEVRNFKVIPVAPKSVRVHPPASKRIQTHTDAGEISLGRSERKILKFLALRAGRTFTSAQVGALTGFKHTGGSFQTYLSRLRAAGLIEGSRGDIRCTDPERAAQVLGADYSAPERSQLEAWLDQLGGGEKKIYQVVYANPDATFSKAELGEQVDMIPTGGSFNTYLSRLSTLGLIERRGDSIRLNPEVRDL
jgi:hypothetical protein